MITTWISSIYLLSAAGIATFGVLGLVTLLYYWRHRHDQFPCPPVSDNQLPSVTVQLPTFNERFVIGRLIKSAVNLDYPRDRLQIQVIDDSTDKTTEIAAELVRKYQAQGVNISLCQRVSRQGYKAGALQQALRNAVGEFIAIFDADFQPERDFLFQTIPHFVGNERLGMVQARWGHLNPEDSRLTGAQAIALDKHFAMEQTVRHRASLYPKFNGSAGVWRRACLVDAGGWEADTVCEDLCLSTRAVLKGWQFCFLNDVVAPAELPTTISGLKNQQARWAKGSTQCLLKFGPAIMADRKQSLIARLYALLSMASYVSHLCLLLLLLAQVPLLFFGHQSSVLMIAFGLVGLSQPALLLIGQRELYANWRDRLHYFPTILLVAIGLAPTNTRAILQALFGRHHPFIRTPKGGYVIGDRDSGASHRQPYRLPLDWIILVEAFLAIYAMVGLYLSVRLENYGAIFFMTTCSLGFGYVIYASLGELINR